MSGVWPADAAGADVSRYEEYLESAHWQRVREERVEAVDRMCERCGEGAKRRGDRWVGLHVHHLNYERVGRELPTDLRVLCIHCHEVEHGLSPDSEANRIRIRTRLAVGVIEWAEGVE